MIRTAMILLIASLMVSACDDALVPEGLYGYQIERLMSQGDSAIWVLASFSINGEDQEVMICDQSIQLHVNTIDTDSIQVNEIKRMPDCSENDTIYWGKLRASAAANLLFRDTIYFENGSQNYAILEDLNTTSMIFTIDVENTPSIYYWVID